MIFSNCDGVGFSRSPWSPITTSQRAFRRCAAFLLGELHRGGRAFGSCSRWVTGGLVDTVSMCGSGAEFYQLKHPAALRHLAARSAVLLSGGSPLWISAHFSQKIGGAPSLHMQTMIIYRLMMVDGQKTTKQHKPLWTDQFYMIKWKQILFSSHHPKVAAKNFEVWPASWVQRHCRPLTWYIWRCTMVKPRGLGSEDIFLGSEKKFFWRKNNTFLDQMEFQRIRPLSETDIEILAEASFELRWLCGLLVRFGGLLFLRHHCEEAWAGGTSDFRAPRVFYQVGTHWQMFISCFFFFFFFF